MAVIAPLGQAFAQEMGTPDDPYDPLSPGHDGDSATAPISSPLIEPKFLDQPSRMSAGVTTTDSCYSSVCLVIDVSGSMGQFNKLNYAKAAANSLIDLMDPDDRSAIVVFSNCYTIVQGFTSNKTTLHNAINSLTAGGYTAALDGIWAGVNLTTSELGAKAVIALSDGMENRSQFCSAPPDGLNDGFADDSTLIVNLALGSDVIINTVSLGGSFDPQYLISLAAGSGGEYHHSANGSDLDSIFADIFTGVGGPEITCPSDLNFDCIADVPACDTSSVSVTGGVLPYTITCSSSSNGGAGCSGDPYIETHQYIVVDNCGKADTCVQTITVVDDTAPVLSGCPANTSVECDNVPAPATVTATDNCSATPTVTFSEDSSGSCPYTLTRRWIATDDCGNADTCTQVITVDDTTNPVCSTINDTTVTACAPQEICIPVSATDNCDADVTCSVISGPGTVSSGNWCYTPSGVGVANVTIECVDDCGNSCQESFSVTYDVENQAPALSFTGGQSPPQCTPALHVVTFTHSDPDGDTLTCYNTNTNATLGDGFWQYSPTPGEHVVDSIICCDPCGLCDTLIIDITFPNPAPPVCQGPDDTTIFQCTPAEVCLPAFATGATCSIVSGPGALVGANWCYTPSGNEVANVTIACAADCDTCTMSFSVTFEIGSAPVITCPGDLTFDCDADVPACNPNNATVSGGTAPITVICSSSDNGGSGCTGDPKIYTYTYIATDDCGKADTCAQTITVTDNTNPTLACPADITVDCIADVPAADINLVTASDNCGTVTVTHEGDSPLAGGACGGTITRTYRATDACGNFAECTQTITVNDQTAPTMTCPADITVDCIADVPAADVNLVTASDNCGSVTVTYQGDSPLAGGACGGTITRTYRATDDCGNFVECTQTITVDDQTNPTMTCPADITVDCIANVPAADVNLVTASDNCGSVTVTHEGDAPLAGGACGGTITRTYRATDVCGNFVECTQTITVNDQTNPTMTCPADVTVDCIADVPAVDINSVTASDNCGSVTVTHQGDSPLTGGACGGTITRTYRATDDCGNFVECTQTITVNDQTNPTMTCPADITVDCIADVPAVDINSVTASDNCGSVTVTHQGDSPLTGGACGGTITRTYRATDDCGNFVECMQTITVNDQTNPTMTCPADVTVDCIADVPAVDINSVTASDNCGSVTVTHQGDSPLTGGACGGTITRTYRATDDCGNFVECTQTITVNDQTNPTMTCPADITVECIADVPAADVNLVTASDNCGSVTVTHQGDSPLTGGACGGTITRIYRATDVCGNFVECTQTITVNDQTNPTMTCPADVTVDCIADVPAVDINSVTASDNCGSVTVTHQGDSPLTGGACGGTITRTYRATDVCGNFVECTQTITVNDQTNPTMTCPADITVDCIADVPAADINLVTASDNCGSVTVTHEGDSPLIGGFCGGTITRTYRATDDCGNFVECTQTITVDDQIAPTMTCPPDITVDCIADVPAADINLVSADDNCGNFVVTHEGDSPLTGGACGGTITRTYRVTDDCGNFVECTQTITVDDQTDPTMTCPADLTVDCVADIPAPDINSVTANDNCGSVTVTHEGDSQLSGTCPATMTRTYRATDDCGNFVECTQTVTVNDQTNPTMTCPADITVDCIADVPAADINLVTASDNCGSVTVTHEGDSPLSGGGCGGTITRTYRATDECGNFVECTQTITIDDQTDPTITCPVTIEVDCESDVPAPTPQTITANDNCGSVTVTWEGDTPLTGGPCGGTITRTYRATDDCGNFTECTQTISVHDLTVPIITCPDDITVDCLADVPAADVNSVTAGDNCGSVTVTHEGDSPLSGDGCGGTIARTYRATDECGNFRECTQIITIDDQTDPTIDCPAGITVECPEEIPAPDVNLVTASDNCGSVVVTHEGDSPLTFNNCIGSVVRTYRATDECGNFAECTQTFTVHDVTPPVWDPIPDTTIALCTSQEVCIPLSATDNCSSGIIFYLGAFPEGVIKDNPWRWCYTPTTSEQVSVTLHVGDTPGGQCSNADTMRINVTFEVNSAPECNLPSDTSLFLCQPGTVCLPVGASDIDGNLTGCQVISGPGSINGGQWCYNATTDESFTVTVRCTDACGLTCQGSFDVDIDVNEAPVCSGPGNVTLERCDLTEIVLSVGATDADDNLAGCQVISGPGTIVGGTWRFTPPDFGEYCVTVECTDECSASCQETFCVTVNHRTDCDCLIDLSINGGVNINALNAQTVTVPVTIDAIQAGIEVGGFDLLLCYDQSSLQVLDVTRGAAIDEWEYFTYRCGANGNCSGASCPTGIIRLVGIADLDNGPALHPSEPAFRPVGSVAEITFYVTPDRNFIGQCLPIGFCSYDCADNTVSSRTGDTLYVDLYNFDPECQNNPKYDVLPSLCFVDGAICVQEPPDDRGDLNLNFIANEVGDAVLYSRFFIEGSGVWDPVYEQSQILASDVNDDGIVLTVADLIYLIRIITGDAQPFPAQPGTPKMAPYASNATATLRVDNGRAVVSTTADVELGGALLVFRYSDMQPQQPELASDNLKLDVTSRASKGELRVLISPEMTGQSNVIAAGANELLSIPYDGNGQLELAEVQISDANGAILATEIENLAKLVPTSYQLYQNYPNPFNAGTVIRFDLQDASDWSLTVYNVAGQRVRGFSGRNEASQVDIQWDGRNDQGQSIASGVYFYQVKAGDFTATRKMTLLK